MSKRLGLIAIATLFVGMGLGLATSFRSIPLKSQGERFTEIACQPLLPWEEQQAIEQELESIAADARPQVTIVQFVEFDDSKEQLDLGQPYRKPSGTRQLSLFRSAHTESLSMDEGPTDSRNAAQAIPVVGPGSVAVTRGVEQEEARTKPIARIASTSNQRPTDRIQLSPANEVRFSNQPMPLRDPANRGSGENPKADRGPVSSPTPTPVGKGEHPDDEERSGDPRQPRLEAPPRKAPPKIAPPKNSQQRHNSKQQQKPAAQPDTNDLASHQYADPWHVPRRQLTKSQSARQKRIRSVLQFYYNRQLNAIEDSPWSMMHHMIAWGSDSLIWTGKPGNSKRVSCIGWLCANGACEGERLLLNRDGKIFARVGPGLQGHEGQFLAMLAQARVPEEQPIRIGGEMFTVRDLIEQEKLACRPKTELTFRLIGLVHYLDTDSTWKSSDGETWDFPKLIREEIAQPINGTTCGGTHRLMGMSYAVRRRLQEGKSIDGQWDRADRYTADFRNYAYAMQNRDGSFSSDFWRSRGTWGDIDRKLKTTGHILEWMVFSSPQDELENPRMLFAVDYLTNLMAQNRYYDWGKGPLGHAVRALSLFDERVYGGEPGERDLRLASRPPRIIPKEQSAKEADEQPLLRRPFGLFRRPTGR